MATFTLQNKNSTSFSNESKNSTSFTNQNSSDLANLWASSVLPWQLALPWQYDTAVRDTPFSNQTKN